MYSKTLKLIGFSVVIGLSLGASCQQVADNVTRSIGGGSINTGNSDLNKGIALLPKAAQAFKTQNLSAQDEVEIGESIALSLTKSPGLVNDDALQAYVNKVGLTVASVADRDDIDFTFGVLNDSKINAISAPRGYIFITRAALMQMRDESELAGALAHEIAHVAKNHGIQTIKSEGLLDLATTAVQVGSNDPRVGQLANVANRWGKPLYNRDQETEADREAVRLLKAAGYDPSGLERFIDRALAKEKFAFTASHPPTDDRVASLHRLAGDSVGGQKLIDRFTANVKLK